MTFTKSLVVVNPQAAPNKLIYDFNERGNKVNDTIDQLAIHFTLEGDYIHTSSNEYKIQEQIEDVRKSMFNSYRAQAELEEPGSGKNVEGTCRVIQPSSKP